MIKKLSVIALTILVLAAPVLAADVEITIPWEGGVGTFTTNVHLFTDHPGETKTLHVAPQSGYRFKGSITKVASGLTVVQTSFGLYSANYDLTIVDANKQGTVTLSGKIEPDPQGGGSGGPPPERPFEINVLQRLAWIYYTQPVNGTNLTCAVGSTNAVAVKVLLGDATAPSEGKITWGLSPGTLGTLAAAETTLSAGSGGIATNSFLAAADGGAGTLTASTSGLKDEDGCTVLNVSTNLAITVLKVELDIDSDYDGDIDDADDAIETSAGGAVPINSDDDDSDNNVDRSESSSIAGENDLQRIALRIEPSFTTGTVKLKTVSTGPGNIKIWDSATKGASIPLTNTWNLSTETVPSNLWIEGISPSTNGARDIHIHLSYENGGFACTDSVAVTVCELFYAAFDHEGQNYSAPPIYPTEYASFTNHVLSKGAVFRSPEYVLVRNSASSFIIRIANFQSDYKAALHAEDAYVGIIAHANTGLGPAFDTTCASIPDFFNVGTPFADIDYKWLHDTYPSFAVAPGDIANGVTNYNTTELGVERFPNCAYTNPPMGWPVLADVPVGGTFPTNYFRTGYEKMHFYISDNDASYTCPGTNSIALLVTAGAADKPTLKYKKLFLNQCRSGRRFSDVMNHGVLFYNHDSNDLPHFLRYRLKTYLDAVLDNKSNSAIEADLDGGLDGDIYGHKEF